MMKKIIIELTEDQHTKLQEHLAKGHKLNLDNETFSGFGINLNCVEGASWLELDMYGIKDLGDVKWNIE